MLEVADIFRLHGTAYQATHSLLPSQKEALAALVRCRTPACGGQLYRCDHCGQEHYSYHSCGNRHCPKCHGHQTERWLENQRKRLLPGGFYFVTVTLPAEFRALVYAHQKELYSRLLSNAAAALQKLAWDPQWLGAQVAILAVLHTWTQTLTDHPHVHLLVSAGGLSRDATTWVNPKNPAFLVPGYAVSAVFKGKFRASLRRLGWLDQVPTSVWQRPWKNVQIQHAGRGEKVLEYLGRYAFRIAINNSRLQRFEHGQVTFGYRDRKTHAPKSLTLSTEEFMRRFLRHVLPKGFVKVRSYGLWSSASQHRLQKARALIQAAQSQPPQTPPVDRALKPAPALPPPGRLCPQCQVGHLLLVATLLPQRTRAP